MKLLIVESPGKVKKIQSFLGSEWQVMASVGHVRDLPDKDMGIDLTTFALRYSPTDRGKEVLARLAKAAKMADSVYLATDPDREGEAIAWHLEDALRLKGAKRITYTEITEQAIKAAIAKPRSIDTALVQAQEGRRALDRLCGYMVSGPLSRAADARLSAGRVQSPALRLVVEREREIKAFKETLHYGVELVFDGWKALWKPWLEDGQKYFLDQGTATMVAKVRTVAVMSCEESESRAAPPAPFTTSSLQQAASNALKLSPKATMDIAQKLYEGGHITYMRTDSPNLAQEAIKEIRAYAEGKGLPLVATPRVWKTKDGAQEAHEAIRPTHIDVEAAGTDADEQALYNLIRLRALASQLADAVFAVRQAVFTATVNGREATFEARGRKLTAPGWKSVMPNDQAEDSDQDAEPDNPVPKLDTGSSQTASDGKVVAKKTKPAPRYTEASLVRELEKRGIGRPSTYAAILANITTKKYVEIEKRFLLSTSLGEMVVDRLVGKFGFIDYTFTKNMEQALDTIANGKASYRQTISEAYKQLEHELSGFCAAHGISAAQPERRRPTLSEYCCQEKKCGKPLVRRQGAGKNGKPYDFYGCSGFPKCTATYPTKEDGTPDLGKR